MTISRDDEAALLGLLTQLRTDHLSSIVGSLSEPDSLIGTTKNTVKHDFFAKLVELDMAVESPFPEEIDPAFREEVTAFMIHEESKPEVARLVMPVVERLISGS